jgi:hypothetical protein
VTEQQLLRIARRRLAILRHAEEIRQCQPDLPLLRHQPPLLLHLAPPLRRPRSRRAPGPLPPAPGQPQRHSHRVVGKIIHCVSTTASGRPGSRCTSSATTRCRSAAQGCGGSCRIDAEEFYRMLEGVVIDDAEVFNDKLQEWEDSYNYHRPRQPRRPDPL